MKTTTLILFAVMLATSLFAQKTKKKYYWKIEFNYSTDCSRQRLAYQSETTFGNNLDYQSVYLCVKKWVYPHKLLTFEITSWQKLKRPDTAKGNKFVCDKQLISNYENTFTTAPDTFFTTATSGHNLWNDQYKLKGTAISRLLMVTVKGKEYSLGYPDSTYSIKLYMKKDHLSWLNDSTAVYKP